MKKALGFVFVIIFITGFYLSTKPIAEHGHSHDEESKHESLDTDIKVKKSPFVKEENPSLKAKKKNHKHPLKKPKQEKAVKIPEFEPKSEYEVSIVKMTELISDTIKNKKGTKELRESLIALGLKPVTSVDKNPYTGTMKIIRTEKNLPGTRYFHTQAFTSEDGEDVFQYAAVDVRGGPNVFDRTSIASAKSFKVSATPDYQKPGFNKWSLGNGRNLWIKKMEAKDLKDDPFNAYSAEDVGTIRVVVELEIHHEADGEKHLTPVEED
jgi:hypothetical protein